MTIRSIILPLSAALALSACGESEEPLDTSYEDNLPPPVQQGEAPGAPVPDNESITGGADEQVDQQFSGEAVETAREQTSPGDTIED